MLEIHFVFSERFLHSFEFYFFDKHCLSPSAEKHFNICDKGIEKPGFVVVFVLQNSQQADLK